MSPLRITPMTKEQYFMQSGDILQIFFLTHVHNVPFERYACVVAKRNYLHTHSGISRNNFLPNVAFTKGLLFEFGKFAPTGRKIFNVILNSFYCHKFSLRTSLM